MLEESFLECNGKKSLQMVDSYLFCLVFLLRKELNVAEVYHRIGSVCSRLMKLELKMKMNQYVKK